MIYSSFSDDSGTAATAPVPVPYAIPINSSNGGDNIAGTPDFQVVLMIMFSNFISVYSLSPTRRSNSRDNCTAS